MTLTLTRQTEITLEHPYTSPTTTLTLKNPTFESTYSQHVKRIYRKTRGLTRKQYRDSNWPHWIKMFITCQNMTLGQIGTYRSFIQTSLGEEIKYTDQDNLVFRVIMFPGDETLQMRGCGYVVTFELEGVRV